MNEFDKLEAKHDALAKRVKALENFVRPLITLEGVDANLVSDQAVVAFVAESIGSRLEVVTGNSRTREATAARRSTAELLHERARWSAGRIARNLNRSENGIKRLLSPTIGSGLL